jgi:hypothetical protein
MNTEERETWKPVNGYEGLYEINESGTVRSLHKAKHGYIMSQRIDRGGYYTVRLAKPNMKSCTVYVHRLLGYAFIPNPDNKPIINHRDGNKLNNSLDNLEFVTHSENMKHAYRLGLSNAFNCREIIDVFTGKIFASLKEAAEYNFIEYPTFKNYMTGSRPNPTSMRYRYDYIIQKSGSEEKYDNSIYTKAVKNPPMLVYLKPLATIPAFAYQNLFSINFNRSTWRSDSLTA